MSNKAELVYDSNSKLPIQEMVSDQGKVPLPQNLMANSKSAASVG